MNLTPDELQSRRPVWVALSNLCLDTELEETDLREIAKTLVDSRYSDAELDAILFDEVSPVCACNLRDVAGVWGGFSPEWLEDSILARLAVQQRPWRVFPWNRGMIEGNWKRVLAHVRVRRCETNSSAGS